jgi:hypothetical protein
VTPPVLSLTTDSVPARWLAIVAPLLVLGAAWVQWTVSNRAMWVGPMDRAFFGWAVVVPLFLVTAPVAAVAWRRLQPRPRTFAALTLGGAVVLTCAVLLARDIGSAACPTEPLRTTVDGVVAGLLVGLVGGSGLATAGIVGARTESLRRGIFIAAVIGVGAVLAWGVAFGIAISFPGCARP